MWAGILMMLPSINAVNASGIKSMATDMAVAQGMGKGEFYTCANSLSQLPAFECSVSEPDNPLCVTAGS